MGRWAQARKRGSVYAGATQGGDNTCPAPADGDWEWLNTETAIFAHWLSDTDPPCHQCSWELWISPTADGVYEFSSFDTVGFDLYSGLTQSEDFWGKVRLLSCDDPPVPTSGFSVPKHWTAV